MSDAVSMSDMVSASDVSMQPAYGLQPPVPFQQPGPPPVLPNQDTAQGADTMLMHNPTYRSTQSDHP